MNCRSILFSYNFRRRRTEINFFLEVLFKGGASVLVNTVCKDLRGAVHTSGVQKTWVATRLMVIAQRSLRPKQHLQTLICIETCGLCKRVKNRFLHYTIYMTGTLSFSHALCWAVWSGEDFWLDSVCCSAALWSINSGRTLLATLFTQFLIDDFARDNLPPNSAVLFTILSVLIF